MTNFSNNGNFFSVMTVIDCGSNDMMRLIMILAVIVILKVILL